MSKELFEKSLKVETFLELRDLAASYFGQFGATKLSYHHCPPLGAIDYEPRITVTTYGYPDKWVKTYIENAFYTRDPISNYATVAIRPFRWKEIDKYVEVTEAEREFLDILSQQNLGDGLVVPLFGPRGRNGYVSLGFADKECPTDLYEQRRMQEAAQNLHLRYCELLQASMPAPPELSQQERATLKLVARGHTNTGIAEQMGVRPKTVATYLDRSFSKLGVNDRMTAALRALSTGLLD